MEHRPRGALRFGRVPCLAAYLTPAGRPPSPAVTIFPRRVAVTYLLRLVGSVIFLGLVLAATQVLCPALSEQLGVDVWELPSVARALDAQEQRRQVLERRMEAALHRHDARKRISEDLIDRRISLDEAVLLTGSL